MHIMNELDTDFSKTEQKPTKKAHTPATTTIHGDRCPVCRKITKQESKGKEVYSHCPACGWKGKKA